MGNRGARRKAQGWVQGAGAGMPELPGGGGRGLAVLGPLWAIPTHVCTSRCPGGDRSIGRSVTTRTARGPKGSARPASMHRPNTKSGQAPLCVCVRLIGCAPAPPSACVYIYSRMLLEAGSKLATGGRCQLRPATPKSMSMSSSGGWKAGASSSSSLHKSRNSSRSTSSSGAGRFLAAAAGTGPLVPPEERFGCPSMLQSEPWCSGQAQLSVLNSIDFGP